MQSDVKRPPGTRHDIGGAADKPKTPATAKVCALFITYYPVQCAAVVARRRSSIGRPSSPSNKGCSNTGARFENRFITISVAMAASMGRIGDVEAAGIVRGTPRPRGVRACCRGSNFEADGTAASSRSYSIKSPPCVLVEQINRPLGGSATPGPGAHVQETIDITRLRDFSMWVRIALAALAASRAQIASTILRCSSIACWVTLACE